MSSIKLAFHIKLIINCLRIAELCGKQDHKIEDQDFCE